jgi:hypothetical protein
VTLLSRFIDMVGLGKLSPVIPTMTGLRRNESDGAVTVLGGVPADERFDLGARLIDRWESPSRAGRGHICRSGTGLRRRELSLLTLGRLNEGITPSRSMVTFIVAPFMELPLSALRTTGRMRQPSAQTVFSRTRAACAALSLSLTSQPTAFRL